MTQWQVSGWEPDTPAYKSLSASVAKGCFPQLDGSDGPIPSGTTQGATVTTTTVIGGQTFLDSSGTAYTVCGTAKDLWLYTTAAGGSWTNKTSGGAGSYSTASGRNWNFCQFGNDVIACNGEASDAVQYAALPIGGTFGALSAGAPKARYCASVNPGFVVLGFVSGGSLPSGTLGNGIAWCGIGNDTSWPTYGTLAATSVQADYQQLASGGDVTGIVPGIGFTSAAVLMTRSIYRMDYVGSPNVFQFTQVDFTRGCIAPNSIVAVGTTVFFLSEDGWFSFDGINTAHIGGGKVDRFFFAELDSSKLSNVYGTYWLDKNVVIWAYPSTSATNGAPDRWLLYSPIKQRWRYCDDPAIVVEYLMPATRTAGYTLDTMDTIFTGGIDASGTFSVDDPTYQGGLASLGGFTTGHQLQLFNGTSIAATWETGESDAGTDSGSGRPGRLWVSEMRALTDASSYTAAIGYRDTLDAGVSYTTPASVENDKLVAIRRDGRFIRGQINIPAGISWTQFFGMDIISRPSGRR